MQMGLRFFPMVSYRGRGYLAGEAPTGTAEGEPDGRAKIVNVPSRVRIQAFERSTMLCVGETVSAADGTWSIPLMSPDIDFTVIGFDDRGLVNAAIQDWVRAHVPEE